MKIRTKDWFQKLPDELNKLGKDDLIAELIEAKKSEKVKQTIMSIVIRHSDNYVISIKEVVELCKEFLPNLNLTNDYIVKTIKSMWLCGITRIINTIDGKEVILGVSIREITATELKTYNKWLKGEYIVSEFQIQDDLMDGK